LILVSVALAVSTGTVVLVESAAGVGSLVVQAAVKRSAAKRMFFIISP